MRSFSKIKYEYSDKNTNLTDFSTDTVLTVIVVVVYRTADRQRKPSHKVTRKCDSTQSILVNVVSKAFFSSLP